MPEYGWVASSADRGQQVVRQPQGYVASADALLPKLLAALVGHVFTLACIGTLWAVHCPHRFSMFFCTGSGLMVINHLAQVGFISLPAGRFWSRIWVFGRLRTLTVSTSMCCDLTCRLRSHLAAKQVREPPNHTHSSVYLKQEVRCDSYEYSKFLAFIYSGFAQVLAAFMSPYLAL